MFFLIVAKEIVSTVIYGRCVVDTPYEANVTYWCEDGDYGYNVYDEQQTDMHSEFGFIVMLVILVFSSLIACGTFCGFLDAMSYLLTSSEATRPSVNTTNVNVNNKDANERTYLHYIPQPAV